ncbi:G2/mitotic-specific cyclin-4 [[Candida] anglica]|uniref:G2/mitotic-specific cyclin-4 n=1 Tax=[Candida] anglica TaxID=148631 RepID=A0ABP0EM05_9ASCO
MKTTSTYSINDENIEIKQKKVLRAPRKLSPNREVLGDVTQHNENNFRTKADGLQKPAQRVQVYKSKKPRLEFQGVEDETDFETEDVEVQIPEEDNSHDVIKRHFDQMGTSSDSIAEAAYNETLEQVQDQLHLHGVVGSIPQKELVENEVVLVEEDHEEEDEEEEEEDDDQEAKYDELAPMEPHWNKAIFNELQYVMKKFSRNTLDDNDEDTYDVTMVAEYAPEIFNYMHELEHKLAPDPRYMKHQDELKWEMRSVLIDWVVQVHCRFNLLPETLYLTVNYIDRFLSKRKVSLSRFQLVGAVALFIAAKYEEINCPTVQEVAYMADNAYSIDDFLKAERFMIDVLEFDMGWPGPMSFLRRTSKADDYDYETRTLAKYFLEITIMDARFVASQPSWLAAGAHYLSRRLLNRGDWTEGHVFYSGYTELQLRPLAEVLLENCRNASSHHKAIFEKYQERRYRRSATFVQEYFQAIDS